MTISKRNGKFYCRFQLNGERHHKLCAGATSVKEAEQMENAFKYKLMQQQNGVIPKETKQVRLTHLFDVFENYVTINKKSYKHDIGRLKIFREFFKNTKTIEEVKPEQIETLKQVLLKEGKNHTTVNRYLESLSKMFNIAIDNGWLNKNPINRKMRFPEKNYVVRYLKDDEEERIFKACPDYFRPLLVTALNTGLRKSNIRLLKWENVKLDYRILEITENKGNKHIKLHINDELFNLLTSIPKTDSEYVFINPRTNTAFGDAGMEKEWNKIKAKAGITDFRFHDLRHTVGTRLAQNGIPVPVIRDIMAHSDIKTTMRYVHTAEEQMQKAMAVLNSYT
jgi:integrase